MPTRTLLVLRHAKSGWDDPGLLDFERPLAPRGQRDAERLAAHLAAGPAPDLVLCSPARRTRETVDHVLAGLAPSPAVRFPDVLYGAATDELLALLRQIPADIGTVLLVGHNPGLQDLVILLAGEGDAAARRQVTVKFPTAALATLDLGTSSWAALQAGAARLDDLVVPRALPG
jgi:phosphohistidine phosphatase